MANPIGLIVAKTIAVVGAVSYGIYERYKKNQLAKEKQDLILRQQQLKTCEEKLHQLGNTQLKAKLVKNQSELNELKENYDALVTKVQGQGRIIKKLKNLNSTLKHHNRTRLAFKKNMSKCNNNHATMQRFFSINRI